MALELPRDRPFADDELEAAVIEVLLNPGSYQPGIQRAAEVLERLNVPGEARSAIAAANGGSEALELTFLATLWRWVSVGLLIPRGPSFVLAPGAEMLLRDRADEAEIVLRRSGLVRRLQGRCPNLDPITERYAGFAHESFFAGYYQAAAVMIGVSCEGAMLHFVPRCEAVLEKLGIKPRGRRNDNAVELLRWVEDTIEQNRKALVEAVQNVGAENWVDDLPGLLGIATGIRLTRNEAGRPSPHVVSRNECRNLLGLYPRLAEAIFVSAEAFDQVTSGG